MIYININLIFSSHLITNTNTNTTRLERTEIAVCVTDFPTHMLILTKYSDSTQLQNKSFILSLLRLLYNSLSPSYGFIYLFISIIFSSTCLYPSYFLLPVYIHHILIHIHISILFLPAYIHHIWKQGRGFHQSSRPRQNPPEIILIFIFLSWTWTAISSDYFNLYIFILDLDRYQLGRRDCPRAILGKYLGPWGVYFLDVYFIYNIL